MSNASQSSLSLYVQEFCTVMQPTTDDLDLIVNIKLKQGWIIAGNLVMADGFFAINMIKVDPNLVTVAKAAMDITVQQLKELQQ